MATIGVKEAQRKAMREAKAKKIEHVAGKADTLRVSAKPPAPPAEESGVSKAKKKAAAPKPKAKARPTLKAKAAAKPAKKIASAKGVDRRPLTVGAFIVASGGCTMAELERQFRMDAHPLRSKIHAAKHKLGFAIEYDAKEKRYTGQAPRFKAAAE